MLENIENAITREPMDRLRRNLGGPKKINTTAKIVARLLKFTKR